MKISTTFVYRIRNPATNFSLTSPDAVGTPGAVTGSFFNSSVPTLQESKQCWVIDTAAAPNGYSLIRDARIDGILLSNRNGLGEVRQADPTDPGIVQHWKTEDPGQDGVRITSTNSLGQQQYLYVSNSGSGSAVNCEIGTPGPHPHQAWRFEPQVTVPFTTAAMAATYVNWRAEVASLNGQPVIFDGHSYSYADVLEMIRNMVWIAANSNPPMPADLLDSVEFWLIHYDGATGNSAPAFHANQAIIEAGKKVIGVPAPDWQEVGGILEPSSTFGGEDAR